MSKMPPVSVVLMSHHASEAEQLAVEERFFSRLRMRNGTYKTTSSARMPEIDRYCADLPGTDGALRLLDIGMSSGVTSLELLLAFDAAHRRVELTGADLVIAGRLLCAGPVEVLLDSSGYVLQVAVGQHARGRPHAARASLLRWMLDVAMKSCGSIAALLSTKTVAVPLVSAVLPSRADARFCEADIFVLNPEWRGNFWLVRAANVLNRDYFSEAQLRLGLQNLEQYVSRNGYLLLNRTHDTDRSNHGSLLQRLDDGSFVVAHRFGDGSELESLQVE